MLKTPEHRPEESVLAPPTGNPLATVVTPVHHAHTQIYNEIYAPAARQCGISGWRETAATVFDSMAAVGRLFQSGIVRYQKEFCPSVVLAPMNLYIKPGPRLLMCHVNFTSLY